VRKAKREEKKRKERERFELVKAKRREKEEKARKLAQLNRKVLSKKRRFTQGDIDLVATNVAAKEEEKQKLNVAIEEKKMTRQDGNRNL
jgi:septum formation topological specificity factor MinE